MVFDGPATPRRRGISDDRKKYTEEEFALILSRAQELAQSPTAARHSSGLSLEEMKSIAAEAGLDSDLVERAARLTPTVYQETGIARILGGPIWHELDTHFPLSLNDERSAHVLSTVRAIAQQQGEGDANAAVMSWHSVGESSQMFVTASNEGSGTRVRITVDRRGGLILTSITTLMSSLAFGIMIVVLFEAIDFTPVVLGWTILGGGVAGIVATARAFWVSSTRTFRAKTAAMMDTIGRALGED